MEAAVEKNLKEEAFRLELVTKKLNTCYVFQVTPVSFISLIYIVFIYNNTKSTIIHQL